MAKMTVAEAADAWIAAKAAIRALDPTLREAADVLKLHFRKTGRTTYDGRIAYTKQTYTALDADKARQLLGELTSEAEVKRERETLTALK